MKKQILFRCGMAVAILVGPSTVALAQLEMMELSSPPPPTNVFRMTALASFNWQGEAELDGGGGFQVNRLAAGVAADYRPWKVLGFDGYFAYDRNDYDFSGSSGLGGLDPWSEVNHFRVGLGARLYFGEHWSLSGTPFVDYAGEIGVAYETGQNFGVTGTLVYTRDEDLSLGIGVFSMNRQQEVRSIYPLILFHWRFAPDWVLRNGAFPLGANGAAGVELAWTFAPDWELSISGQYQTRLFRLDDAGPAPEGFGLEDSIPVYATLSCRPVRWLQAGVFAGAMLGGELELEARNGHRLSRQDYEPAPFIGLQAAIRF